MDNEKNKFNSKNPPCDLRVQEMPVRYYKRELCRQLRNIAKDIESKSDEDFASTFVHSKEYKDGNTFILGKAWFDKYPSDNLEIRHLLMIDYDFKGSKNAKQKKYE